MKTVFSTQSIEQKKRFAAWQEALCEHYLKVNTKSPSPENYEGFLQKSILGPAVLSEVLLSAQHITRNRHHIARLDKDCFYVTLPSTGYTLVEQAGKRELASPGKAVLFDAAKPYHLHCSDRCQSIYVEIPRALLSERCKSDRLTGVPAFHFADGLGWVVAEFCRLVAQEAESMQDEVASKVAEEIADLLALCIHTEPDHRPAAESIANKFRLQSLKAYIESKLDDPNLTPEMIAKENRISVRYLHYLFRGSGMSVSEWVRERRLEKSHQRLTSAEFSEDSITEIAFSLGFNSSSHFTRLFKQKYGMPPRYFRKNINKFINFR